MRLAVAAIPLFLLLAATPLAASDGHFARGVIGASAEVLGARNPTDSFVVDIPAGAKFVHPTAIGPTSAQNTLPYSGYWLFVDMLDANGARLYRCYEFGSPEPYCPVHPGAVRAVIGATYGGGLVVDVYALESH